MGVYYKVVHLFFTKQPARIHFFDIGIYDSKKKAFHSIEQLKTKEGFCLRPDKFHICKVLRFRAPRLLNRTYWIDGFITYTGTK